VDRRGERFGKACYSSLPKILLHLSNSTARGSSPKTLRMTFQRLRRQLRLQRKEFMSAILMETGLS
jgi:hypothetical protein